MFDKRKTQQPQGYQPKMSPIGAPLSGIPTAAHEYTKGAPVMRPNTPDPKAVMRRQMMAQMLMQQPFQNPQMARPQFSLYSQGY